MIDIRHLPEQYQRQVLFMVAEWSITNIQTQWRLHNVYMRKRRSQGIACDDRVMQQTFMAALTHLTTGEPIAINDGMIKGQDNATSVL